MALRFFDRLHPIQILLGGYLGLTTATWLLLSLPWARTERLPWNPLDQLFTAASAVTTTGLVVHDTSAYTLFGQIVLLAVIQIAGLGYMVFIALSLLLTGNRLSLGGRALLRESVGRPTSVDLLKFAKSVLIYSFIIEGLGTLILMFRMLAWEPPAQAFFSALFHSVSAFCTAGFSIYGDNYVRFAEDPVINVVTAALCILGAIGFFVLDEVREVFRSRGALRRARLSVHSRLTLIVTALLTVGGTVSIYVSQYLHGETQIGWMEAAFQVISGSSTAGFNTIDLAQLSTSAQFVILVLMFVGGSPGSTAGGVKTTTFGLMLYYIPSLLLGRRDLHIYRRRIPAESVIRGYALAFLASLWVAGATIALGMIEPLPVLDLMFEVTSALATAGLSTGITAQLSWAGELVIILTMLVGRIGMLGVGFSLIGRRRAPQYQYAQTEVLIG